MSKCDLPCDVYSENYWIFCARPQLESREREQFKDRKTYKIEMASSEAVNNNPKKGEA
jgi:hypothetical protein